MLVFVNLRPCEILIMDIENLKTFLEVYKTRHFGKAADNLFLTSAAVSARIKQLEQYLGVSVFIRNRGNVQLTSEGERLLPHAEHLVQTWAATLRDISLQKSHASSLQIGATAGLWQFALATRLSSIRAHLPDSHIQAEALPDETLVRRLLERSMDVAVLYEPPKLPQLKAQKIGQLKLLMASTDKHQKAHGGVSGGLCPCGLGRVVRRVSRQSLWGYGATRLECQPGQHCCQLFGSQSRLRVSATGLY